MTIKKLGWAVAAGMALSVSAAQAATWTYSSTGAASAVGLSATASAFSATNNTTATIGATTAYYGGGLGITTSGETTTSPQHAIDNNGPIETLMIGFSDGVSGITAADKVNLTSAYFGWTNGDADFSVYAYTGASTSPSVLGLTFSNLTSNGWQLIGHYNADGAGTYNFANSVYSSHWLIGAFNGTSSVAGLDFGDDYFKLDSVIGNKCPTTGTIPAGCGGGGGGGRVPEPATLLLMSAGLFGLSRFSKRNPLKQAMA